MPFATTSWIIPTGTLHLPPQSRRPSHPRFGSPSLFLPFSRSASSPPQGTLWYPSGYSTSSLRAPRSATRHTTTVVFRTGTTPTYHSRAVRRATRIPQRSWPRRSRLLPTPSARLGARGTPLACRCARKRTRVFDAWHAHPLHITLRSVARHAAPGDTSPADLPLKARSAMRGTTPRQETETVAPRTSLPPPTPVDGPAPCTLPL